MNSQTLASDLLHRPTHRTDCPFVSPPCPTPSSRLRLREKTQSAMINSVSDRSSSVNAASVLSPSQENLARPDAQGRFGKYGGKYVPETLIAALSELEEEFKVAIKDPKFQVNHPGCNTALPPGSGLSKTQPKVLLSLQRTGSKTVQEDFQAALKDYVGRASPLYHAERLSEHYRQ